jgi:hypothetical protein
VRYYVRMAHKIYRVKSSYVSDIGYDPDTRVLDVWHKDGNKYSYLGVGPDVHEALMESSSKGGFIASRIRGMYREAK